MTHILRNEIEKYHFYKKLSNQIITWYGSNRQGYSSFIFSTLGFSEVINFLRSANVWVRLICIKDQFFVFFLLSFFIRSICLIIDWSSSHKGLMRRSQVKVVAETGILVAVFFSFWAANWKQQNIISKISNNFID